MKGLWAQVDTAPNSTMLQRMTYFFASCTRMWGAAWKDYSRSWAQTSNGGISQLASSEIFQPASSYDRDYMGYEALQPKKVENGLENLFHKFCSIAF